MKDRIILDLCGGTGAWSKPYSEAGYDVRLVTLPEHDVRVYIPPRSVYGVLAAPPCTHLSLSGARWWHKKGVVALREALYIVDSCYRIIAASGPTFWVLENPVGRLVHHLGKPKMYFHPWEYGDPYTKKTCLWGRFNIPERHPVEPIRPSCLYQNTAPGPKRGKLRSITPPGFARAFFESNR